MPASTSRTAASPNSAAVTSMPNIPRITASPARSGRRVGLRRADAGRIGEPDPERDQQQESA